MAKHFGAKLLSEKKNPKDLKAILISLGVFRTVEAEAALGLSRWSIARMAERGELIRADHGIYFHPEAEVDVATLNYVIAAIRFGKAAVISGLTALFHYVLIEQVPSQVWVMMPHSYHGSGATPKLFRILRTNHDPKVGVEDHGTYRFATPERAIVEAFAYATKIGLSIAITAGRKALRERKVTEKSLYETAELLGRDKLILSHWEALTIR